MTLQIKIIWSAACALKRGKIVCIILIFYIKLFCSIFISTTSLCWAICWDLKNLSALMRIHMVAWLIQYQLVGSQQFRIPCRINWCHPFEDAVETWCHFLYNVTIWYVATPYCWHNCDQAARRNAFKFFKYMGIFELILC